ncbi:MAG: LysM peptidoglycan-binding domain-containing protein [Anaerolineales bacterium]|nr:LysM peptidoglycan-binding domain-containing protein [Anaerolineales bacterium]
MTINTESGSASNVINSYRKRQQRGPFIIWGIAGLLIVIGIIVLVVWFTGDNKPQISLFATETPTPTLTSTPTITPSPTSTPTLTMTPTVTFTPTPSVPFSYIIEEGESLNAVAEKFNLGDNGILLLLALNPQIVDNNGIVFVGQEIIVPNPGMELPTPTSIPADLPRGTLLEYTIQPGDSIAAIAAKFNSTEEGIIAENELEDANAIFVGQIISVPANLVTPVPTRLAPTSSPDPNLIATPVAQATSAPEATPLPTVAATCTYTENTAYVNQVFTLINNARVDAGLPALTLNDKLTAAAKAHAIDMGCNNFMSHTGTNGSSYQERITEQGYTFSIAAENLFARPPEFGGDGQTAFDWWMSNATHRDTILSTYVTEIGISYVAVDGSMLGGYFSVIFASP